MTRIAVLGANGQVAAEVCLLLAGQRGIDVVPICRNTLGSAFLRYHGFRVRHGQCADSGQAPRLIGDCDLVLNFALATGRPREASDLNRRIIENAIRYSRPGARIVFFSTLAVYGDPIFGGLFRWKSAYAREKLRGERRARRAGRKHGKPIFILRLGHVTGDLQAITSDIRERIAAGPVPMIGGGAGPSHATHTATIADAVLRIEAGAEEPGTYDLISTPPWTWREVYTHEATVRGIPLVIRDVSVQMARCGGRSRLLQGLLSATRWPVQAIQSNPMMKEAAMILLAQLPAALSRRSQAVHFQRRAALEIAELDGGGLLSEGFLISWPQAGKRQLKSLTPTADLLRAGRFSHPVLDPASAFPADLPGSLEFSDV